MMHLQLFLRANRRYLLELAFASLLVNVFALALPLFSMLVYDKAIGNDIHDTLWALTLGMLLLGGLDLLLRLARVRMVEHAAARWDMGLDERLLRGVLAAPATRQMAVGGVLARYREVQAARDVLSAQMLLPLADLPFVLVYAAALAALAGPLVLVPLVAAVLLVGASVLLLWVSQRRSTVALHAQTRKVGWLADVLIARESLLSTGGARVAQRGMREPSATGARAASRARLWQQTLQQLMPSVMMFSSVALLVAGVFRVEAQALSVGGLISSTMLASRLLGSVCGVAPALWRWREFVRALRELHEAVPMDAAAPLAEASPGGPLGSAAAEGVRLEGVCAGYGAQRPVLDQLTLRLDTGALVAVVGSTGAGKSTLLRLLAGHLEHDAGQLAVGARVMDDGAARRWLAAQVAYKPQEPGFLAGRVRDIVAPGEDADDAALVAALRSAGLGPALDRGELGLETVLGSNGSGLSGGQRQMLALARALHQRSDLLLLDEPTLGLDRQAQETLLAALPAARAGRCVVVATHSAELIQICDRVLVFDRGRLVADAPPQRLLAPGAIAPRPNVHRAEVTTA